MSSNPVWCVCDKLTKLTKKNGIDSKCMVKFKIKLNIIDVCDKLAKKMVLITNVRYNLK